MKKPINIIAYTDGSATVSGKNKGAGGFGTYFPKHLDQKPKAYSLGFKNSKTGRMEISALYYAIASMPKIYPKKVLLAVYSDSEYVVKSFTENRLVKWIKNGWRNTSGEVKNKDLWEALVIELNSKKYLSLEMIHIRSHQVEKEKDPTKKAELLKSPHIIGNLVADSLADYKRHIELKESDKIIL